MLGSFVVISVLASNALLSAARRGPYRGKVLIDDWHKNRNTAQQRNPARSLDQNNNAKEDPQDLGPISELFRHITHKIRKERPPEKPVYVKLDLTLLQLKETNEKEGILESVVIIYMEWHNKRLVWDPKLYDNVSMLLFGPNDVWIPDVAVVNSADHPYTISRDFTFKVRLDWHGKMRFVPTGLSRTWCKFNLHSYPFDLQKCSFSIESWSMDKRTLRFANTSSARVSESFYSPQWTMCSQKMELAERSYAGDGSEIFSTARIDIVMVRKSAFYIMNLIFPCAIISAIQMFTFTLSSKESLSDRIGIGILNMLTMVIFLTNLMETMPKSSDAVSSMSNYVVALISVSCFTIFQSVFIARMLRITKYPPPKMAMRIANTIPNLWSPDIPKCSQNEAAEKEEANKKKKEKTNEGLAFALRNPLLLAPALGGSVTTDKGPIKKFKTVRINEQLSIVEVSGNKILSIVPYSGDSMSLRDIASSVKRSRYNNGRAWAILANKLDSLLFFILMPLTFALPLGIFLPHLLHTSSCSDYISIGRV